MRKINLSTSLVPLREASGMLCNVTKAPCGISMEVGEHDNKFYLVDWVRGEVCRLTLGAFKHLRQAWGGHAVLLDQLG